MTNPRLHDPHPQSGGERARLLEGIPRGWGAACGCDCPCHATEQVPGWPGPCAVCCEPGDDCDCGRALAAAGLRPVDMAGPDPYEPERRHYQRRRRDRRALVLAAIAAAGLVFLAGIWAGRATATSRPSSGAAEWRAVTIGGRDDAQRTGGPDDPMDSDLGRGLVGHLPDWGSHSVAPILEPDLATLAPRPVVEVPVPEAQVTVRSVGTASVSGIASFYDWHPGEAAACAPLRAALPDWRGRVVSVSGIAVRLTDYCPQTGRVIDLDDATFARLAPLSRGLVSVTVTW